MYPLLRHAIPRIPVPCRLSFLLLASLSALVVAAPEPHGKHFLLVEGGAFKDRAAEEREDASASVSTPTAEMIAALRERLDGERLESGPYSPAAVETLIDLARLLEAAGQPGEALELREEALHLIRVNEGLYSERQGPVLRALLDSLRGAGDFDALDLRYRYFFRLYGAGRPPFTDLRWKATIEYLTWQREALRRELDADDRERLLDLHGTQAELLTSLAEDPETDWRWLCELARSQLATLYIVEDSVQPELQLLRRSQVTRVRGDELRDFDLLRERLENLQRTARAQGQALIEGALARVPADEIAVRAGLRLDLADWQLWHDATRSARESYAEVWRELERAGREDLLGDWFLRPQPLPRAEVFAPLDRPREAPLSVRIDVSAYGRVQVSSAGIPEAREREFSALRRLLRASRFRPAFRDGEAVDSDDLLTSWVLLPD